MIRLANKQSNYLTLYLHSDITSNLNRNDLTRGKKTPRAIIIISFFLADFSPLLSLLPETSNNDYPL